MQAKRTATKGSTQKTNSHHQKIYDHDQGDFQMISESQHSEYSFEESQTKQPQTGRRLTNNFQKQRRAYKSNSNVVLSQLFDVKSIGQMAIFRNLFEGVESWEILEFLDEYHVFLEVLILQMEDRTVNFDIDSFQKINFKKDFLYEPVPRTFICGLMRLKELRGIQKKENCFEVTQTEIKALYVSSLLLINIGEIPKRQKNQKSGESTQNYFHRIVSYLLDQSGFLTPKLFYYITLNWNKIIEMIVTQFEADQGNSNLSKNPQNNQQNLNQTFNQLKISEKTKPSLDVQSSRQEIFQDLNLEDSEIIVEEESYESRKSQCKRVTDMEFKFLSESKPCQKTIKKPETQVNPEKQNYTFKRPSPIIEEEGEVGGKKRIKLNSSDPAVQKARKFYNYGQFYTRDRTRSVKSKQKKTKKSVHTQKQNKQLMKEVQMTQKKVQEKPVKVNIQEQVCFGLDFENLFDDDYQEKYTFRRKDSISSIDYIFSESYRSESDDEGQRISSEEKLPHNHQDQTEEGSLQENQMEEPVEETGNANRKVRHEKREIDQMINAIIKDRFVMIQSIACQIYHSLKVMNCRVVQERIGHYRRNLTQLFDRQ